MKRARKTGESQTPGIEWFYVVNYEETDEGVFQK
jgi:hypothetical protein